ncbi:FAD-dependent oxidoreductase [Variovorax sp. dw_308]|uniref:FAD-dependent oxidoreductase n=1 Tax=Variovorax sp. dw_308 TaxID=2721546 RepID=UPI001C46373D|nr:FAD-dependent oxidoreductase [Variovorax sp. dw_308]
MTTPKKIAILGGGMAGLSAAWELTRTPELRALHEVTLYQMGWRLGGKAASGRDALGRNLEHGLHVWFGCYANVFHMVQEIYANRTPPPGCPLQHWTDVAKPQIYTPIGVRTASGFSYFPLTWPTNQGTPGQGGVDMTPAEAWTTMWNLFVLVVKNVIHGLGAAPVAAAPVAAAPATAAPAGPAAQTLPSGFAASTLAQLAGTELERAKELFFGSHAAGMALHELVDAGNLWMKALLAEPALVDARQVADLLDLHRQMQASFHDAVVRAGPAVAGSASAIEWQVVEELIDIAIAAAAGYFIDLVLPDRPFESLDEVDFRAWLIQHGANPGIVATSTVTRIVYDTLFQYADGDVQRPSYAAGTALGVCARLIGTFKGSMMWDIQTGMGEAVVAPLYEALVAAGVKVEFFHKVTKLELSADGQQIETVRMARQADIAQGDYRPTFVLENLVCWPSEPDWDQLVDGAKMKAAGVDFESHWCNWPPVGQEVVLNRGSEFDTVVLAISMGAYKPLNDEPTMCNALLQRGGRFADFVNNIGIVPTQGLQLWSNQTLDELGWTSGKPATVSGPEYLNIWADMTQVLAVEPAVGFPKPKSLHYLCGTWSTTLYRQPSTQAGVPAQAWNELRSQAVDWLNDASACIWPAARTPEGKFRFEVLSDFSGATGGPPSGTPRFDQQFLRANIDPTECCVLSAAGTTKYRLHPAESGFANLILAGEATRHGFNTTAIEGAVMSGMAASRAICGQPATIVGYDFLQRKPSQKS